ncbi:MAG: hypothetical protein JO200_08470 [Comamonas sp.]|nr:hypothetical protein [Comamonas sp.]
MTKNQSKGRYAKRMAFYSRQRAMRGAKRGGIAKMMNTMGAMASSAAHYEALSVTTAETKQIVTIQAAPGPKRWHVLRSDGVTPACGAQMVSQTDKAIDAIEVPDTCRCMRPGCKQLWPTQN